VRWLWLAAIGLVFAIMPYTNRTSAIRYNNIQRGIWLPLKTGQNVNELMKIRKGHNGYEWRFKDELD
jgi:5,10-methylenetetrahydrofolate reductase